MGNDVDLYPKSSFNISGLINYYNFNFYPNTGNKKENVYGIELSYPANSNKDESIFADEGIWLNAEHKQRKYSNQNKSFLITTIIGVLIAIIIELVISILSKNKE